MRRIGTHSGSFHVDEALGVFMLKTLPEYQNASVIRSREEAVLNELDILIDVGSVYDPERHRFDHHQRGFFEVFAPGKTTKLSSAGLVYKHFGERVVARLLGDSVSQDELKLVYYHVYDTFIEGIDGVDNGVPHYFCPDNKEAVLVPAYHESTSLSARVGRLNNPWNNTGAFDSDAAFAKAVALAGEELVYFVNEAAHSWLPARRIVAEAFESRISDEIVVLKQFCPWIDHLFNLEKEYNINVKYVIFGEKDSYRVRAVPVSPGSFQSRLSLPEKWCGLRDGDLDAHLSEKGGVFVHANGFIGGHRTLSGAIAMAKDALMIGSKQ